MSNALALASVNTFRNTITEIDALTLCASLPEASVDLVLTDPPYGTTACSWDVVVPFVPMWAAFKRVLKPRGAVVMTAAGMFAHKLACSNEAWFKYDCVWINKQRPTGIFHAKNRPLRAYESVLVFSSGVVNHPSMTDNRMTFFPQMTKGKPYRVNVRASVAYSGGGISTRPSWQDYEHVNDGFRYPLDVLEFGFSNHDTKHPTQKPVPLFEYLIKTYTQPGALILDPFAGSGTTAIAAKITGRDYICGDTSAEYVELARRRVNPEFGKAPRRNREPQPLEAREVAPGIVQDVLFSGAIEGQGAL